MEISDASLDTFISAYKKSFPGDDLERGTALIMASRLLDVYQTMLEGHRARGGNFMTSQSPIPSRNRA